ncbi:MAG TPA: hypothetical protein VJG32_02295 [Anaerolineae bacterium]|nr:hypothetical protein [Anaerolineae bacterium]
MFESSSTAIGLLCLAGGVVLGFIYPLGRKNGEHLLFNLVIIALFILAAYNLIPKTVVESDAAVLVIGLAAGGVVVVIRSIRRWLKYFQGAVSRRTSPYYWYRRALTRRSRR